MALHTLRLAPRSLTLRLRARRECPRRAQRSWVAGGSSPYVLASDSVVSLNCRDEVLPAEYHTIRASQGTKVP